MENRQNQTPKRWRVNHTHARTRQRKDPETQQGQAAFKVRKGKPVKYLSKESVGRRENREKCNSWLYPHLADCEPADKANAGLPGYLFKSIRGEGFHKFHWGRRNKSGAITFWADSVAILTVRDVRFLFCFVLFPSFTLSYFMLEEEGIFSWVYWSMRER